MIFFVVYTLFYVLNHNLSKRELSFLVLNTRLFPHPAFDSLNPVGAFTRDLFSAFNALNIISVTPQRPLVSVCTFYVALCSAVNVCDVLHSESV